MPYLCEEIVNLMPEMEESCPAPLRLTVLGGVYLQKDARPLDGFVSRKAPALLVYLALEGQPCPRGELAALLWGEMPESDAQTSLRKVLSNLGQLLAPHIHITRQVVHIPAEAFWLDAAVFLRCGAALLQQIEGQTEEETILSALRACLELYRGEFLAGFQVRAAPEFEAWALLQRERLHNLAVRLLYQYCAQLLARGRYHEASEASTRLLELEPWNEDAHRQRMLLLACDGQRSAALRQYELCRHTLQTEFGALPGAETEALYQRLLNTETPLAEESTRRETGRGKTSLPFIGRDAEHAWLLARWHAARRQGGGLTLLAGEAGVGKTRLIQQTLLPIVGQGGLVLSGRCYEFNRALPYQAIQEAIYRYLEQYHPALPTPLLAELARLSPALYDQYPDLPHPIQLTAPPEREIIFETLAAFLKRICPARSETTAGLVLFLDDLHWADADTLDLVHYLTRRLADVPCWLVGAYRPEETPPLHPLHQMCFSLDRDHLLFTLPLHHLPVQAVHQLAAEVLGQTDDTTLGDTLYRQSQGNPFLLGQLVAALQECDSLPARGRESSGGLASDLPAALAGRVQEMILQRIHRLGEASQYLLTLAAVLGQPFDSHLLQSAGNCSPETVAEALSEWQERGLLRPAGAALDFAHDHIRAALYYSVPAPLRRLVHARLATAIEMLHASQPAHWIGLLAHHFDQACDWPKALHYLALAGIQARQAYAHEQALGYYQRALTILRQETPRAEWGDLEFDLLSGLEMIYDIQSRRQEQRAILDELAVLTGLSGTLGSSPQPPLFLRQADILLRQSLYAEAVSAYAASAQLAQEAITRAEMGGSQVQAAAGYRQWACALRRQGQLAEAREHYQQALALAERSGALWVVSDSLQGLANIARNLGQYEEARACLEHSLRLCRQNNDRRSEGDAYNILGLTFHQQGDFSHADDNFQRSLSIRREIGDQRGVAVVCNNLGRLAYTRQDYASAQAYFQRAWTICQGINDVQGEAVAHTGLCQAAIAQKDWAAARTHGWCSLRLNRKLHNRPQARQALSCLQQVAALAGAAEQQ